MYIVYYRYSKYHLHKLSTHLPSSSSWNLPGNFFQKKTTSQQNTIPGGRFLQSRAEVLRSIARHETFVLDYQTMNVTPWVGRNSWRKLMGNHESGGGGSPLTYWNIYLFFWGGIQKMFPMFIFDVWNFYVQHMVWIGKFLCWTCWFTSDKTNFPKKVQILDLFRFSFPYSIIRTVVSWQIYLETKVSYHDLFNH